MQIGGCDVGFDNARQADAGQVFDVIRSFWPHARFEDDNTPRGTSSTNPDPGSKEFFVYRNYAAWRAVNKYGVEDYLKNEFVHIILEPEEDFASIVVGDRNEEMSELIGRLENRLGWKQHEFSHA